MYVGTSRVDRCSRKELVVNITGNFRTMLACSFRTIRSLISAFSELAFSSSSFGFAFDGFYSSSIGFYSDEEIELGHPVWQPYFPALTTFSSHLS